MEDEEQVEGLSPSLITEEKLEQRSPRLPQINKISREKPSVEVVMKKLKKLVRRFTRYGFRLILFIDRICLNAKIFNEINRILNLHKMYCKCCMVVGYHTHYGFHQQRLIWYASFSPVSVGYGV